MAIQNFSTSDFWQDLSLESSLLWYRAVSSNQMPAKYLVSHYIPVNTPLSGITADLWAELDKKTQIFLDTWFQIKNGSLDLDNLSKPSHSLLDLIVTLAYRMLHNCTFCQWKCRVNRGYKQSSTAAANITEISTDLSNKASSTQSEIGKTKLGTCQLESTSRVGSYFHHLGEEIIYRGTQGSGTIFFTSCNMRCGFCQNGDISRDKENGLEITPQQLAKIMRQLRVEGVHNINLVGGEPTIHLHTILDAINKLATNAESISDVQYIQRVKADLFFRSTYRPQNTDYNGYFNAPILWNSNFFMSEETMKLLRPVIDIWLPDLKFGSDTCAIHLARTPQYWVTATRNIKMIYEWGEEFSIRHLIMPNHVDCCTKPVLNWIKANTPNTLVNIMDQYHPDCHANPQSPNYNPKLSDINRYPTKEEILESFRYAKDLGLSFEALTYEKNQRGLRA